MPLVSSCSFRRLSSFGGLHRREGLSCKFDYLLFIPRDNSPLLSSAPPLVYAPFVRLFRARLTLSPKAPFHSQIANFHRSKAHSLISPRFVLFIFIFSRHTLFACSFSVEQLTLGPEIKAQCHPPADQRALGAGRAKGVFTSMGRERGVRDGETKRPPTLPPPQPPLLPLLVFFPPPSSVRTQLPLLLPANHPSPLRRLGPLAAAST